MIEINGYKFAEKESEIVDSLFQSGGTVSGRAKRYKRKIMFYDIQKNPLAFINQNNILGTASRMDSGKIWYSYGDPYFVDGLKYADIREITKNLSIGSDHKSLLFK